ncbi:MAG: hypothetical protein ACLSV2_00370 [Clostridium sp.]
MKYLFKGIFIFIIFNFILCGSSYAIGENYNLAMGKENKGTEIAVAIREDGIWTVNINDPTEKIMLNKGKKYREPIISEDGYVAYRDINNTLYISKLEFDKTTDVITVDNSISAYQWYKNGKLIYSKSTGGAYIFNTEGKTKEILREGKEFYTQILLGKDNSLFATKNIMKKVDSNSYAFPLGIIKMDLISKKEKVVVPYVPINSQNDDLGLDPKMATISINGVNLFVWCRPNSASITADGVPIGIYNNKNNKCKEVLNEEIIVLTYKDMMSISPIDDNLIAIINGADRFMGRNKTLGVFKAEDESFKKITKESEVAMTPSYSTDGKKIIYSASSPSEDLQQWEQSGNQHIYEVNLESNEIKKLTSNECGWDFYPKYINNNDEFILIRKNKQNKLLLIKKDKEGNEQIVIDNILNPKDDVDNNEYYWYYGHYDMEKIFDNMKINQ